MLFEGKRLPRPLPTPSQGPPSPIASASQKRIFTLLCQQGRYTTRQIHALFPLLEYGRKKESCEYGDGAGCAGAGGEEGAVGVRGRGKEKDKKDGLRDSGEWRWEWWRKLSLHPVNPIQRQSHPKASPLIAISMSLHIPHSSPSHRDLRALLMHSDPSLSRSLSPLQRNSAIGPSSLSRPVDAFSLEISLTPAV